MKHLVIGNGEIGKAFASVLKCDVRDVEDFKGKYDIIHICFPYYTGFERAVIAYRINHSAKYVVVHSTVPVGTCRMLGVAHSPVTGVHPHLQKSLMTFTKFIGGVGANAIAKELRTRGMTVVLAHSSDETEAGKLFNLMVYGINVLMEKEIHDYCVANKLDYKTVYKKFVDMYNSGYADMGLRQYQMYRLEHRDGAIGGHCVVQNAPMLGTYFSNVLRVKDNEYRGIIQPCSTTRMQRIRTWFRSLMR
jgi:hypothetical protein